MMVYIMFNPSNLQVYAADKLPENKMHRRMYGVYNANHKCVDVVETVNKEEAVRSWQDKLLIGTTVGSIRTSYIDVDVEQVDRLVEEQVAVVLDKYPEMFI